MKSALLEEALEAEEPRDPLPLAARAAAFGLDFAAPARVLVVGDPRARRAALRGPLHEALQAYFAHDLGARLPARAGAP